MKLVTLFADFEGDMCMYCLRYNTKLLALAKNARFSNISATKINKTQHNNLGNQYLTYHNEFVSY